MSIDSLSVSRRAPADGKFQPVSSRRAGFVFGGLILCGIALLLIELWLGDQADVRGDFFLLPWMALVAMTALIPCAYLYIKRRLVLYHPLVYGAVLGIIPGFVIGPFAIIAGVYDVYAYSLIPDPKYYLPLALVYVAIGFAGLTFGYALPIGRRLGRSLSAKLPAWNWSFGEVRIPALLLMAIGEVCLVIAVQIGSSGYQMAETVSVWGQTLVSLSSLGTLAQLILWFTIFRAQRLTPAHLVFAVLLIGVGIFNVLMGGNKGGVFWQAVFILMVFLLAGRQLPLRRMLLGALVVSALVLVGVSYGNAFRNVKGSEQAVGVTDYLSLVSDATSGILTSDWGYLISKGAESLFRRTEITTHLGVIVSNYKEFAPVEGQYGLANNITTDLLTALVPRFVWADKPLVSNARALSTLYFNVPNNSYAITPFGDLLRNFGPVGIPIGMAILGIVLAMFHQLVAAQPTTAWRAGLYYALLTAVSYEGFYGSIFPAMIRAGVVTVAGVLFLRFLIGRARPSSAYA